MRSINKVILVGNVTKTPEVVTLASGIEVAKFSLAINESYKKQDGEMVENVMFIDCEAWSGLAKVASNYVNKGSKLYVEGNLKEDKWADAETGKQRSKFKVRITEMLMLDSKRSDSDGYSSEPTSSYTNAESKVKPAQDDELPF